MNKKQKFSKDSQRILKFLNKFNKVSILKNKVFNNGSYLLDFFNIFDKNYKSLLKNKINIKKNDNSEMYLDNINSCNHINKKHIYKTNLQLIINILKTKYNNILENILSNLDFESRNKIEPFLITIEKKPLNEIIDFMDNEGLILSRYLYINLLEKKLPNEILNIVGDNTELYGEFTSFDINRDIEINIPNKINLLLNLGDINLDLILFDKSVDLYNYSKLFYRIFFLHYYLNEKEIKIKIWLSNLKKILNRKKKQIYIGPREINTGCTIFNGIKPNKVSLWRKEELGKVVIHELIHSLELEKHNNLDLYDYFDVNRDIIIRSFESYVEIMAQLLNLVISVNEIKYSKKSKKYLKKIPKTKKYHTDFKLFLQLLDKEKLWSLFQCGKILNYYGYKNFNEFFNEKGIKNKTQRFKQTSNVFSYIILRSIIYNNLGEFLILIFKYNTNNILEDNIPDDIKINFFIKSIKKNNFIDKINFMINYIEKNRFNKIKQDKMVYNSMRLSCIETKII